MEFHGILWKSMEFQSVSVENPRMKAHTGTADAWECSPDKQLHHLATVLAQRFDRKAMSCPGSGAAVACCWIFRFTMHRERGAPISNISWNNPNTGLPSVGQQKTLLRR